MIWRALPLLLLLTVSGAVQAAPSQRAIVRLVREDQCRGVPGYAVFRQALQRVAAAQDVRGLQQLFHPRGSMRVHGVYMTASAADADSSRFAPMFAEIHDILARGCARNGKRLIMAGLARLAEDNVATETLVVMRPTWLHRTTTGARLAPLRPGQLLTEIHHGDRWARVQLGRRTGSVPTRDVRNPYDTRIEAEWIDGRWAIIEFGSGI